MVLLVEDDPGIGPSLVRALAGQGYRPRLCTTGADALAHPLTDVDLVLLDLGLPDMDGLDVCAVIGRRAPTLPVIVLTARGTETDVVVGLDAGAVDYLVKPFGLAELLARVRVHTRASAHRGGPDAGETDAGETGDADLGDVRVGDVTVQAAARRVFVAGSEVALRAKEFDLLLLLIRNAGRVVTRPVAMAEVWDQNWVGSTKTLDVHVAALRQRLGGGGAHDSPITTVRGVGYRFEQPSPPGP